MRETSIDLSSLMPIGNVESGMANDVLHFTTTRAIHDVGYNIRRDKITSYLLLPGMYRLPMRIDMRICMDAPEMLLLIGDGHISIGSPWMENRRIEDIASAAGKPKLYDNSIPFGEFVDISIIYNLREMQICIGAQERYYSTRERYMKSECFAQRNELGFGIGLTCTKRADASVRSITIAEHEDALPCVHDKNRANLSQACVPPGQKPTFASCIEGLPPNIKDEILRTDDFLKSLPRLKFKRTVEKHGNKITYVESARGISYALYLSGSLMHHSLQWYIVTNGKPEMWHRKSNPMEDVLDTIAKSSPALAGRIFRNLNECIGCRQNCLAKTPYAFRAQKKTTCHGQVFFKMSIPEFQDVRDFFSALDAMPPPPEKGGG